jgi:hypothetical protein
MDLVSLSNVMLELIGDDSLEAETLLDLLETEFGDALFTAFDFAVDYLEEKTWHA